MAQTKLCMILKWTTAIQTHQLVYHPLIRALDNKSSANVQENYTEKRLKWHGHVMRMKEEHVVRRMLDANIPGKRRRGWPNLRWKDACERDMTEVGLKEDNTTNRLAWRN